MFIISKLFNYLILPPGVVILLLIALLVLLISKRSRVGTIISASAVIILYGFSISPVSRLLLKPLEHAYSPLQAHSPSGMTVPFEIAPDKSTIFGSVGIYSNRVAEAEPASSGDSAGPVSPRAIVVLGGGVVSNNGAVGSRELLTDGALPRYVYALKLHRATGLPIYLSGGAVLHPNDESSAAVGKRFLEGFGVSPEAIFIESSSRNTWENADELKYQFEIDSAYLVTSAYHMKRSTAVFEAQDIAVIPAPTGYVSDGAPFTFWDFLPSGSSLDGSFKALHEYIGLVYYKVRYGI